MVTKEFKFKNTSKKEVKKQLKSLSDTIGTSIISSKKEKKKDHDSKEDSKDGFDKKSDYYITLDSLICNSFRKGVVSPDKSGCYTIRGEFVRVKPGKRPFVEIHKNVDIRYLACVVSEYLKFERTTSRGFKTKERDDGKKVIFIPIQFLRSLIIPDLGSENCANDLYGMSIFRYTGEIESFRNLTLFNLATEFYLTDKASVKDRKIQVIV